MTSLRPFVVYILLFSCTTLILPKELLHEVIPHEDDEPVPCFSEFPSSNHNHVEKYLSHCSIWQLQMVPTLLAKFEIFVKENTSFTPYFYSTGRKDISLVLPPFHLRAPPYNNTG